MLSDPIVALATPPARSAVALVRLSGVGALEVASRVIRGFQAEPARQPRLATLLDPDGAAIDRGLYTVFAAPRSYTGHDLVEIGCHGGPAVYGAVLAALQAAGARSAAPGEFTRRALLNGKLDLVQAEATGALVSASSRRQARAALHRMEGGLSRRIVALREQLVDAQALLCYDIDFPEEDDGPVPAGRVLERVDAVSATIDRLLATAPLGERLREGALVVLAGRPNAGKSSLFNALLGSERALVTELPGTTRDAIEATTSIDGWPFRLADTAGLRDSDDRIERLGIEVSRRYLAGADLVLLCVEAGREPDPEETSLARENPAVVVRTKADLTDGSPGAGLPVSTVTRQGLDTLREELVRRTFGRHAVDDQELVVTEERHRLALERALEEAAAARPHLAPSGDPVLAAHHLRIATESLEEILGRVDTETILDRLFATFCVGK
jgi:tRNA modification GTPase